MDQNREQVHLGTLLADGRVLLVFYPFAFTRTCTGELNAIQNDPVFSQAVKTVTVSCDTWYSQKVFAEREGFDFTLLSDFWPHGAVASDYGVFNSEFGFANRGTFLIDGDGVIRFAQLNGVGQARDPQAWRAAIAAL